MCEWLSHFLFGFPDPHLKADECSRYFRLVLLFLGLTVGLSTWDVVSDVLFIVDRWSDSVKGEPCALDVHWLVMVTLVPCLPIISSILKGRLFNRRWATDAAFNWRLARKQLMHSEEQLLVIKDGQRINPEQSIPIWDCAKRGLARRVKHIFPLSFVRRCCGFAAAWKRAPDPAIQYSYDKDIEYQDFHLQRAQLTEIKYESCPQLIILLLIMGTSELYHSCTVWVAAAASFLSIAKYFPSVALLPGKCAFNNKIFGEKDCVDFVEADRLLKPRFFQWFGALVNFFYIICRYHLIVWLAIYNWFALFLTVTVQVLTVCVFLVVSYLRLSPTTKYSFAEQTSRPIRRTIGKVCAFGSQLLTSVGYFLLVPVTTTMTMLGTVLATLLQLIAVSALTVVVLVDPANWTDRKDCRGSFLCAMTPLCPAMFKILLSINVVLSFFLPLLQYTITRWTDSGFRLRHRTRCEKCREFQKQYCNRRPCWLCESTWCDELEKDQNKSSSETDPLNNSAIGRRKTPLPFLQETLSKLYQNTQHSMSILEVLASLETGNDEDFLLCETHVQELRKTESEKRARRTAVADGIRHPVNRPSPLAPLSVTDPDNQLDHKLDPPNFMHQFLRKLYSGDGLYRTMPYQLFYKSKFYDSGIKDPQEQNQYWAEIKKLRGDHTACDRRCLLYENKSTGSGMMKLSIWPPGLKAYEWRLDKLNDRGKPIPDLWEYEYFNDVSVLCLESFDVDEPVRECPLRKQRNGITV